MFADVVSNLDVKGFFKKKQNGVYKMNIIYQRANTEDIVRSLV